MQQKIKQLVYTIDRELKWRDIPSPTISDRTSALVRPIAVARSDLDAGILCEPHGSPFHLKSMKQDALAGLAKRIHLERYTSAPAVGQQCIAEIMETGPDVAGLPPGKRVVVTAKLACGDCKRCLDGMSSLCESYGADDVYGSLDKASMHGGLVSDLMLIPHAAKTLVPLPDGLDALSLASAGSDLGDAWCSVTPHLQGKKPRRVLCLGGSARSTALYAVALAVSHGVEAVAYLDESAERVGIAAKLGANAGVGSPRRHKGSYDLIVSGNTESGVVRGMIGQLNTGGTLVQLQPMLLKDQKIPLHTLYSNNLNLSVNQAHILTNMRSMLDYLNTKQLDLSSVNTHLASFDDAVEHFAKNTTKVVLHRPPLHR